MADPTHAITDLNHLNDVTLRITHHLTRAINAWIEEDANAYTPPSGGDTHVDTSTIPDLTNLATRPTRHRDRDHIGRRLLHVDQLLTDLIAERTPRTPNRPCACCHLELATHGRDHNGHPTDCHACHRYLRRMKHRCTDDIHADRPRIRWCECPDHCCDPCPDKAAEGRRLSDRCRQRKTRGLWETAS